MKKRHNLESRRRVFDRWQQSGLAAEEFARQSGVSYSSLCRWRREFDRAAPAFVEVVADHGAADEPVDGGGMHVGVEIAFPTGVVVRVGCEVDEPLLRRVVRAVASS
jgi:hypothetical protein